MKYIYIYVLANIIIFQIIHQLYTTSEIFNAHPTEKIQMSTLEKL